MSDSSRDITPNAATAAALPPPPTTAAVTPPPPPSRAAAGVAASPALPPYHHHVTEYRDTETLLGDLEWLLASGVAADTALTAGGGSDSAITAPTGEPDDTDDTDASTEPPVTFAVHAPLLRARSPYWATLLSARWCPPWRAGVVKPNVAPAVLSRALRWAYTGDAGPPPTPQDAGGECDEEGDDVDGDDSDTKDSDTDDRTARAVAHATALVAAADEMLLAELAEVGAAELAAAVASATGGGGDMIELATAAVSAVADADAIAAGGAATAAAVVGGGEGEPVGGASPPRRTDGHGGEGGAPMVAAASPGVPADSPAREEGGLDMSGDGVGMDGMLRELQRMLEASEAGADDDR
ncbi:hypothetical protein MMPV_006395 [Pyropia vietnamensis]